MKKKRSGKEAHKQDLADQLENPETYGVRMYPHKKKARHRNDDAPDADGLVEPGQSEAILQLAREQHDDATAEAADAHDRSTGHLRAAVSRAPPAAASDSEDDQWDVADRELPDGPISLGDEDEELTHEDEEAFNAFMRSTHPDVAGKEQKGPLLSDLIMQKLQAPSASVGASNADSAAAPDAGPSTQMDDTMRQIYEDVGLLLQRYTAGKLPKAFKIVPYLRDWEEAVFLMRPELWSPHATYAATKMFVSQLNAKQVQRFLNLVLLNKVRDDIRENKRLHFALFQAVKKAVWKPGAFYKGFVLPLLKAGDCTLREAVILSGALKRVSIPVDHSSAALLKMAEMPYSGVTSFFIKTLLDKKYALPYRVVDALVDHFVAFKVEERAMPLIWHMCLLTFVQRYKFEIRGEDKQALRELLKEQFHKGVSPEVLRELNHGTSRGEARADSPAHAPAASKGGENVFQMAPVVVQEMEF